MTDNLNEKPESNFGEFIRQLNARKKKEAENQNHVSNLGVSSFVVKRRKAHNALNTEPQKIVDPPKDLPYDSLKDLPEDLPQKNEQPRAELPTETIVNPDKTQKPTDQPLEDIVEIGPDGSITHKEEARGGVEQFESPVAPVTEVTAKEIKPQFINADNNADNAKRAKQAVEESAVQIPATPSQVNKLPPPIDIKADQPDQIISEPEIPKPEQIQPFREPKAEEPVVTIDKVGPEPVDNAEPTVEEPITSEGLMAEQVDQASTEKLSTEEIPITVNKTIQPVGEYIQGPESNATKSGLARIDEIKQGINRNPEDLKTSKGDEFDRQVEQARETTLNQSGIDPNQINHQIPLTQTKKTEPEVTVESVSEEGPHRLNIQQMPERNPLLDARTTAKIPPDKLWANNLYQLIPGNMSNQAESADPEPEPEE